MRQRKPPVATVARHDAMIDSIVIATAAQVGAPVLTADVDDLAPLADRAGVQVIPFP